MEVKKLMDAHPSKLLETFRDVILPKHPSVFHEWFLEKFPEPSRWFSSRLAYASSLATMSIVGYIVGLGDRHGENILFDECTGSCVHVDLNCLFEKGQTFEIPERVPFRLTHNLVDAMGITGVEGQLLLKLYKHFKLLRQLTPTGVFRKCSETTLSVVRTNRESLMSVLETFLHDPLCEWSKGKKSLISGKSEELGTAENELAVKSLKTIDRKLRGYIGTQKVGFPYSPEGQVNELILQATSMENLCRMYIGWAAFM